MHCLKNVIDYNVYICLQIDFWSLGNLRKQKFRLVITYFDVIQYNFTLHDDSRKIDLAV